MFARLATVSLHILIVSRSITVTQCAIRCRPSMAQSASLGGGVDRLNLLLFEAESHGTQLLIDVIARCDVRCDECPSIVSIDSSSAAAAAVGGRIVWL